MNTKQTPDYGEPWKLNDYNTTIGETGDYEGVEEILTRDNVLAAISWNPDDEDQERFQRIIQCVNDCAGMVDPAAEIEAMREAIKEAYEAINTAQCQWRYYAEFRDDEDLETAKHLEGDLYRSGQAAIAKLKPFIKP